MLNIFRRGAEGTEARVVGMALTKPRISVQLVVVNHPKERAAARGGGVMPNAGGKSIIV